MIKVEDTRIIRAPIQKVFQLVSRLEAQPHVTGLWFSADLLDRRPNAATVHYKGYFGGIPVESVQRATMHPPQRVEFKQSRGGMKAFAGRFSLKPIDGETELSMQVEADVGITLITEASARRVLHTYVERSLQKIKFLAERDLPRLVRRSGDTSAAAPAVDPPTVPGPLVPGPLEPGPSVPGSSVPGPSVPGPSEAGQPGAARLPAPGLSAPSPSRSPQTAPQATQPGPGSGRRPRRRRRRRRRGQPGTPGQGPAPGGQT